MPQLSFDTFSVWVNVALFGSHRRALMVGLPPLAARLHDGTTNGRAGPYDSAILCLVV